MMNSIYNNLKLVLNDLLIKDNINTENHIMILLRYQSYMIYNQYFNILKNKINNIKNIKYKSLSDYKEIIVNYNNIIKKINDNIYNLHYDTYTVDSLKKENTITIIPEIMPFKAAHGIYKNFMNIEKNSLVIKGLICFVVFKKTKMKEMLKILIFNADSNSKILDAYDIYPILNHIAPKLILELKNLVNNDLYNDWKNTTFSINDLYIGYITTLSYGIKNYNKSDILDVLYFYKEYYNNNNIYMHIYYKIHQLKKNSNSYNFIIFDENFVKNYQYILYDLEYKISDENNVNLLIENNNIYMITKYFHKIYFVLENNLSNIIEIFNNYNIKIGSKTKKIILPIWYNNQHLKYKFTLKDIIYSNFLNKFFKFNYNNMYLLDNKQVYITDVFSIDIQKNLVYEYISSKYIIKKNNIIIKKDNDIYIKILLNLDNDSVDWKDFLIKTQHIIINKSFYMWFINKFMYYVDKYPEKSEYIIKTIKHASLYNIFKKIYLDVDNHFKNFINLYYNNCYIFNGMIKHNELNNLLPDKHIYIIFIDILQIFLYICKNY